MSTNSPVYLTELLFDALTSRHLQEGKDLIEREAAVLHAVPPEHPSAPRLFYVLAGWAEYSKTAVEVAQLLYNSYRQNPWPRFSLDNWGWIVGGKASLALYEARYAEVDECWQWMQENAAKFGAAHELLATLDFARAQSKRKCAHYPLGLELIGSAMRHYGEANLPGMVAVAQAVEGWLLMQVGNRQRAAESWNAAFTFLKTTEDWILLGNLSFSQARRCCRADLEKEGLVLFLEAAALHERWSPPHRNLRHIYTDLADLELRMASKCADSAQARDLWKSACAHIEKAANLLEQDPSDHRNRIRLLLAQANQSLLTANPTFYNARRKGRAAYQLATSHGEELMIARARYKQAVVEKREADDQNCDDPVRKLSKACRYAFEALQLAGKLHSDRLAARIHTFLGNIFLEFPFCDPAYAAQEWEAAVQRMSPHEDFDYVVKQITALEEKLTALGQDLPAPGQPPEENPVIIAVSEQIAFEKPLEETSRKVEKAIVLAAVKKVGPGARAIAETLRTGRNRIERYLATSHLDASPAPITTHHVIFRVKTAFAFSRPLEETIKTVERAIIRAAWIRYGCDKTAVKERLRIGFDKVVSALDE